MRARGRLSAPAVAPASGLGEVVVLARQRVEPGVHESLERTASTADASTRSPRLRTGPGHVGSVLDDGAIDGLAPWSSSDAPVLLTGVEPSRDRTSNPRINRLRLSSKWHGSSGPTWLRCCLHCTPCTTRLVFIDRSVDNASTVVYRLPGLRAPQRRRRRRRSRSAGRQAQPLFGEQGGPGCGADRAQKWHDDEQLQLEQGASGVLQAARRAGSVPRLVVAQLRERGTKRQPVSGVVRAGALLPGQDAVLTVPPPGWPSGSRCQDAVSPFRFDQPVRMRA